MRRIPFACQPSFEQFARAGRREQFVNTMDAVVPWDELETLIEPYYPKAGNGRLPVGLGIMLRICFLQHWFNLSDPGAEDALYDSPALRGFAGVDLGRAAAPDETTILKFRHLLEQYDLCGKILDTANRFLDRKGIRISTGDRRRYDHRGAIVDQEGEQGARSPDASDQAGQPVLFRCQGAFRR